MCLVLCTFPGMECWFYVCGIDAIFGDCDANGPLGLSPLLGRGWKLGWECLLQAGKPRPCQL